MKETNEEILKLELLEKYIHKQNGEFKEIRDKININKLLNEEKKYLKIILTKRNKFLNKLLSEE
jgi:hypothetical protein